MDRVRHVRALRRGAEPPGSDFNHEEPTFVLECRRHDGAAIFDGKTGFKFVLALLSIEFVCYQLERGSEHRRQRQRVDRGHNVILGLEFVEPNAQHCGEQRDRAEFVDRFRFRQPERLGERQRSG